MATLLSEEPDPLHYVTKPRVYLAVFAALMIGTALTVLARQVDLGAWNAPIALTIAVVKTSLVVLYFMHLRHSQRLTWVVVLGAFLWVLVLFALTFSDYVSRAWMGQGVIG